ncbi:hypothetical protein PR048_024765 [Dryococelus australis]|uniref:Uncharacterized protein n=1 Tax=Dryococelus australis TaxID=614101 RepID=A0ABQ9GPJ5_9NEOP|nr:hypothetical protein PR048_024765 [Dryococelus australis]
MKGRGKREIPEKTRLPTASSSTIPTCDFEEIVVFTTPEWGRIWAGPARILRSDLATLAEQRNLPALYDVWAVRRCQSLTVYRSCNPCALLLRRFIVAIEQITSNKIAFKRVYTEVTFAIGSEFIRHALDDSAPIADMKRNKSVWDYLVDSRIVRDGVTILDSQEWQRYQPCYHGHKSFREQHLSLTMPDYHRHRRHRDYEHVPARAVCSTGRGGIVVRLLASHQVEPGLIPSGVTPGFSRVGIVPNDAADRRPMGDIEVSMEQRRNERAGETGDLRENPPTNGMVRHDSHMRKSGVTRPEIEPETIYIERLKRYIYSMGRVAAASCSCEDQGGRRFDSSSPTLWQHSEYLGPELTFQWFGTPLSPCRTIWISPHLLCEWHEVLEVILWHAHDKERIVRPCRGKYTQSLESFFFFSMRANSLSQGRKQWPLIRNCALLV